MGIGLVAVAIAADGEFQYLGLPLAQVDVVAVEGELPAEDLMPLLRAQQGQVVSVPMLRGDIALLYSTGAFAAIQADAEPWFFEVDGQVVPAVRLTYEVVSLPVIRDIEVRGAGILRRPKVQASLRIGPGDRWLETEDQEALTWRVQSLYADMGFDGTSVRVVTEEWAPGELILVVEVAEGEPVILDGLGFGPSPLGEQTMRRAARRAGLVEGRRFTGREVRGAKEELLLLFRDEGYLEARVSVLQPDAGPGDPREVSFFVESGPRVVLEVLHASGRRQRQVRGWLRLDEEVRVDRTLVPELERRVVQGLQSTGYPDAAVTIDYAEDSERKLLVVELDPGTPMELDGWIFEGNMAFEDEVLAAALREASPQVLGRGYVTDEALAMATEALQELYRSQGFLEAQLTVEELRRVEGRRVTEAVVVIRVEEGDQTRLETVWVEGAAPEVELLADDAGRQLEDRPYSPAALRDLERQVVRWHQDEGYLQAEARARVELSEDGRRAAVVVWVEPGGRLYVRNVVVRGQRRTRTEVISREISLETGQPITPLAVNETRTQLYDLDAFKGVQVELKGTGERYRDVIVTVDEKPAWTLEGGGGLATDEGLRSFGRATRRGLWGRAHRFTLLGRVGVGYDGDSFQPAAEDIEWYAGLRYEAPNLPRHQQLLVLDVVGNERLQEPTYRLARSGAGAGAQLQLTERSEFTLTWRVEGRWLEDVDPGALVLGDPWLDQVDEGFGAQPRGEVEMVYLLDRRDDPFNPSSGSLLSLQLTATDPWTTTYWSVQGQGRGQIIVPVGQLGLHLDAHAGLGWVGGRGTTLPIEERFRLGGASTLRGYSLDSVGPKNELPDLVLPFPNEISGLVDYATRDDPLRWVPTGGDSMLLFTMEWWVPFPVLGVAGWSSTSLVGFVDVGNVYFLDPTVFTTSTVIEPEPFLRYGAGVGLRQATPVGPLQLDLAVNPLWFTTDWAAERGEVPLRLHLSLGAL